MNYLIRETYNVKRGKVPEYLEDLKIVVDFMKSQGITDHRVCVDITDHMDTVYHEWAVDSLDEYFAWERGVYADPDADTTRLINKINDETVAGNREIYEIIL